MAEEDQNVRIPMGDRGHAAAAVMDVDEDDEEERAWREYNMDDRDKEENYDNDDEEEDESDDVDDGSKSEEEEDNKMAHNFIRTFHNGDYDKEIDDKLSYDRGLVLPNTQPTQASFNKPDNWIDRNRIGLEKVKEQLKELRIDSNTDQTSKIRLYLIYNEYWHQLVENEEPIVWHEPILDRYWDVLEAEIDSRRQQEIVTDIRGIHIENVEMKKESMDALVDICRSRRATISSTMFNFDNDNVCNEGILSLSKLVEVCSELQEFHLYHNRIDNMDSARCLSRALKSHTGINRLSLAHCDLGSSPEILSIILQSNIKIIHLDNKNINSLGAVTIAEYLEGDPPIYRIDLDHNCLNDDNALLISQALKRTTMLKIIISCYAKCNQHLLARQS
jgi:hypothetical protein